MKPVLADLSIVLRSKLTCVGVSLTLAPVEGLTILLIAPIVALVVPVTPLRKSLKFQQDHKSADTSPEWECKFHHRS